MGGGAAGGGSAGGSGGGSAGGGTGGGAVGGGSGGGAAGGGSGGGGGAVGGGTGGGSGGGGATGGGTGGGATGGGSGGGAGAGGGTGGGAGDGGTVLTGVMWGGTGAYPGPIAGLHYRSGSVSGYTDDAGTFQYESGQPLVFSIGDVDFRPGTGEAHSSPYRLAAAGSCDDTPELTRALVLLYSVDVDGDPANGLQVPTVPHGSVQRAIASLTDSDIATEIDTLVPGRTPLDAGVAVDRFITAIDSEEWTQIGTDAFPLLTGAVRSQGVTTDGTSWYFSWTKGFDVTDDAYNSIRSNPTAIPLLATLAGDNHIGDIDYLDGVLWAPLEDGSAYQNPKLCAFDPQALSCTTLYDLSNTLLTQGVPYVIADGPRSSLYVSQWDPIDALFVLDVATVTYQRSIPLHTQVGRIQGGKVFEGAIYLASDNAVKSIYKVREETGTVIELMQLNHGAEQEGMAFRDVPDGGQMHTLNVDSSSTGTELRHFERTRLPLRKLVCP